MRNTVKCLTVAVLLSCGVYGQKNQVAGADKEYKEFAYVDAIKVYEKVFDNGYKSADMLKKLANAYYFQADYGKASKWYGELFLLPDTKEGEYYYRYAQSLKATQNYTKADELLNEFYKMNNQDSRARLAVGQKNYLDIIKKNSGRYTIGDAGINSDKSDFGSAFYNKKIVFASAREKGGVNSWDGQFYTDLYAADFLADGSLGKASKFGGRINTKYNESTPVFTKDGQTVYFTRNNYNERKRGKDKNDLTLLKLYKATKDGDNWKDIKELPFNSNDYSVAHPALSLDEKTLYFVSDMPGSIGSSDIFKVSINGDDSYGTPVNLGTTINTEGKETFPFISAENELYFASDGHPGLGGLDIFISKTKANGEFDKPQNVGGPVNSSSDDFAFLIDTNTQMGFFSSNRALGKGKDDIYKLREYKKIGNLAEQSIVGTVSDVATKKGLAEAVVILSDANHKSLKEVKSDNEGNFDFGVVDCDTDYNVRAEKKGYSTNEKAIVTGVETGVTRADITIEKEIAPLVIGNQEVKINDDLAKLLSINMIYFDTAKSDIRRDAEVELAKILAVLEQNPKMELDIRSHTDCRSSKAYNLALSDKRAKATIAWLVKHGISKSRLTGRGYGESQLLNNCECEGPVKSTCSEEEHQQNRRSEFIIKKF